MSSFASYFGFLPASVMLVFFLERASSTRWEGIFAILVFSSTSQPLSFRSFLQVGLSTWTPVFSSMWSVPQCILSRSSSPRIWKLTPFLIPYDMWFTSSLRYSLHQSLGDIDGAGCVAAVTLG